MKLLLKVAKCRLLPSIGWITCSVLAMFAGGISGIWIAYFCLATGLMESTDKLFTGWTFLTVPCVGGVVGLAVMHIVRIRCWLKLQRRYMKEYEGWSWKHTIGIVLIDETIWLVAFVAICAILVIAI